MKEVTRVMQDLELQAKSTSGGDGVTADAQPMEKVVADVWRGLEAIGDPCIVQSGRDLSIVDLGLINTVWRDDDEIYVSVTLTDSMCVNAGQIFVQIERIAEGLEGISEVNVVPRSYPLWTEDRLSEKAKNLFADDQARYWPKVKSGDIGQ